MRNAIPREAHAVLTVPADTAPDLEKLAAEYAALFNEEYQAIENHITFTAAATDLPDLLMPEEIQDDFVNAITGCPNGVFRYVPSMPEIVETSMNLSIVKANAEEITVQCLLRSSVDSKKEELASMLESVFALGGAKVTFSGDYSGWNPNLNSPILNTMKHAYKEQFGTEAKVTVVHAGLECGIIGATETHLDMVSIGPTLEHPHTPDERVYIPSVRKFWDFVTHTLTIIPEK